MEQIERDYLIEKMADNLPVFRAKLRISQDRLASVIGSTRFTVMQIETKKRKMTWQMFMLLVLIFDKNCETAPLLRALEIYTDELDALMMNKK